MERRTSAPGKLFLFGEYAVLRGAPALVTAVDRRFEAALVEGPPDHADPGPFARAIVEHCGGLPEGHRLHLDSRSMRRGAHKLGLGSSAALCVSVAALLRPDLSTEAQLALAHNAHRDAQGGVGSGGDLAASSGGGLLRVVSGGQAPPTASPLDPAAMPPLLPVWLGKSASTPELVGAIDRASETDPATAAARFAVLGELADEAACAAEAGDSLTLVTLCRRWHRAIEDLAAFSGAPLVPASLDRLVEIAESKGAAAKASGAGGGDLALVFAPDPDALARVEAELAGAGLSPVPLPLFAPGVREEPA